MKINLGIVVLSVLICLADYWGRLNTGTDKVSAPDFDVAAKTVSVSVLTSQQTKPIAEKLALFNIVTPAPTKQQPSQPKPVKPYIMPADAQQQQQGQLDKLFDDHYKYTLRATFNNNGQRFALVEKQDLDKQKLEKLALKVGDNIAAYQVSAIGNNSIDFKAGSRHVQLQLFLNH